MFCTTSIQKSYGKGQVSSNLWTCLFFVQLPTKPNCFLLRSCIRSTPTEKQVLPTRSFLHCYTASLYYQSRHKSRYQKTKKQLRHSTQMQAKRPKNQKVAQTFDKSARQGAQKPKSRLDIRQKCKTRVPKTKK